MKLILSFVGASLVAGYIWLGWAGAVVCLPLGGLAGAVAEMIVNAVRERKAGVRSVENRMGEDWKVKGLDLWGRDHWTDLMHDPAGSLIPGSAYYTEGPLIEEDYYN